MDGVKVASGVRKTKKKQVKDELDRIKQAEKKKRRLEKALATSAAIRSELEKKKQKKKEEQERLDEECAAIAEAVALRVLVGEDSDDSCIQPFDPARRMGIVDQTEFLPENHGWFPNPFTYGHMWGSSNYMVEEELRPVGILSADHLAAQAVSSLRIADDSRVDAYAFNHILKG